MLKLKNGIKYVEVWRRVCIITSVNMQRIFPSGRPEEVSNYAKKMIETLAGYMVALSLRLKYLGGFHIESAFKAFWKYGKYPRRTASFKKG